MIGKKCLLCNTRKGIRYCSALNSSICSLCCGTKRRRTISCPDDCIYLIAGRNYRVERSTVLAQLDKIRNANLELISRIEQNILTIRTTRFRNLLDEEVKPALENVLKTIETAERKIIYEYRSPNPRIQLLADSVYQAIEKYQKDFGQAVAMAEAKGCLKVIINALTALINQNSKSTVYLDFIQQFAKENNKDTSIIPGKIIH